MWSRYSLQPARPLRPIVRPGAPAWAAALDGRAGWTWSTAGWLLAASAMILTGLVVGTAIALATAPLLGFAVILAPFVVLIAAGLAAQKHVFRGPAWTHNGMAVKGEALDMVEDIQMRFDYARKLVREVPTGINWSEVKGDVQTLLWESVDHAAQVSALDHEIHEMRYAAAGTPQGALLNQLKQRRDEHWRVLLDNQREAELLARAAGNAAAAARVALARTGSLRALEIVVPSVRTLAARGSLGETRARLSLLADVWAELDETGTLTAERLGLNEPRPPTDGAP